MQAGRQRWLRIRVLWAALCLVLSLAIAPALQAAKHGPGAMAAEADHRAFHAEHGQLHGIAGSDHHDSTDHDHVSVVLLASPGAEIPPPPERTRHPGALSAAGTIGDGPRRPPRPVLT
jgi:hypothetical protein